MVSVRESLDTSFIVAYRLQNVQATCAVCHAIGHSYTHSLDQAGDAQGRAVGPGEPGSDRGLAPVRHATSFQRRPA